MRVCNLGRRREAIIILEGGGETAKCYSSGKGQGKDSNFERGAIEMMKATGRRLKSMKAVGGSSDL